MAIDYDEPRHAPEDELTAPLEGLKTEKSPAQPVIDVDEAELADDFTLPGADLSHEELLVQVVPIQADEFTCMSCFLVHHRSQLAREQDGNKYCLECES
ncbi:MULTISPECIES: DUF4193 domain-containing protein [Pseudarthrobacter]|jgi:hypothetical protein|uniref:DUF4193 domain-containing protein n=1 Tax=Pseudarthrobacter TaxID=1742993 RepID=UPI0013DC30D7|nr:MULTISPECIES: DUF4193 domain-containing protein [Pseudarthrobacter]MDQ0000663.1 hypothetical protein [Pseudarthrobacter sulfonivorans]